MATGTIFLSPLGATLPDGSSGNLAPALSRFQGTESNPKKHFMVLSYDGAGAKELAFWTFRMPVDYASAPILKIQWMSNTTSAQTCVWSAQIGAITSGDADTVLEHAAAAATSSSQQTNTTEARRLNEASISLANLDSVATGDLVFLTIYRDSSDGSDSLTIDAELIGASLEYTTT